MENLDRIKCELCGTREHVLELHLDAVHEISAGDYLKKFPEAPLLSELAKSNLAKQAESANAARVDFDIYKTFGVKVSDKVNTVVGWSKPHVTTPAVDPDYVFSKEVLKVVLYALEAPAERVLLSGPTGSGKSSVVEQIAARLNLPFTRINCDSDLTRGDFVGEKELDNDHTYFRYGLLPIAMKEGHILLIDEWDVANPSVAMALQGVLEENGKLVITETGEVITAHPDFRIFATSNTLGMGDDSGLYNGTQPQNFAQLNRFTMVEIIDYPKAAIEKKIVKAKTGIDAVEVLDKIMEFAKLVRAAYKKEEIVAPISTRNLVNIGRKLLVFGDVERAYKLAFINSLSGEDRTFCTEILQRVWGV